MPAPVDEAKSEPRPEPRRIRVADFSGHVSGPTASLFLRAAGADVIKVENPRHGDGNRFLAASPWIGGNCIYHHALNWGARSVVADPRADDWGEWITALSAWADVVMVGGRPEDVARLGLDRTAIAARNARAIHCHITGYGMGGPWAARAAHGQNPDALSGLIDVDVDAAGDGADTIDVRWRPTGTSIAGVVAAVGVLAALWHRSENDEVLAVETSLWEAALWFNWRALTAQANGGSPWGGNIVDFGSRYATYLTADRRPLIVAPVEEKFWRTFCDLAGLPDLAAAGDWSRRHDFGEQEPDGPERRRIAAAVGRRTLAEWLGLLAPTSIPYCEILDVAEVLAEPQLEEVEMLVDVDDGGVAVRPPFRLRGPADARLGGVHRLPGLGEHTDEVRAMLGMAPVPTPAETPAVGG